MSLFGLAAHTHTRTHPKQKNIMVMVMFQWFSPLHGCFSKEGASQHRGSINWRTSHMSRAVPAVPSRPLAWALRAERFPYLTQVMKFRRGTSYTPKKRVPQSRVGFLLLVKLYHTNSTRGSRNGALVAPENTNSQKITQRFGSQKNGLAQAGMWGLSNIPFPKNPPIAGNATTTSSTACFICFIPTQREDQGGKTTRTFEVAP